MFWEILLVPLGKWSNLIILCRNRSNQTSSSAPPAFVNAGVAEVAPCHVNIKCKFRLQQKLQRKQEKKCPGENDIYEVDWNSRLYFLRKGVFKSHFPQIYEHEQQPLPLTKYMNIFREFDHSTFTIHGWNPLSWDAYSLEWYTSINALPRRCA